MLRQKCYFISRKRGSNVKQFWGNWWSARADYCSDDQLCVGTAMHKTSDRDFKSNTDYLHVKGSILNCKFTFFY